MSDFQYLVPCVEWSEKCNLDWAAVSAMGGWVAAIVTFLAVLLPYRQLKREAKARQWGDDVEADIALRNSVIAMTAIFSGLNTIQKGLAQDRSVDSARAAIEVVRKHVSPNPLPDFPRAAKFAVLRAKVAHLGATVAGLNTYVSAFDEGIFDDETANQFAITILTAVEIFGKVIAEIDACVPGICLAKHFQFAE